MISKPDASLALDAYAICKTNACGRYGTDQRGSTGCLELHRPCSLLDRLYESVECPRQFFQVVNIGDGTPSVKQSSIDL